MRLRFNSWFVLVMACALLSSSRVLAAIPAPTAQLGVCQGSMASAQDLFPGGVGHKILVVSFAGKDAAANELGRARAQALSEDLTQQIRQGVQKFATRAGMSGDELRVRFMPCLISSAEQAREVGQTFGADLLLWGKISDVQLDLSTTVVRWNGQLVRTEKGLHRAHDAVLDLQFPRLELANLQAFHRSLLAVHAYWLRRHAVVVDVLAGELDSQAAQAITSGYPNDLYRLLGRSLIFAGKPGEGRVALQKALALCRKEDLACRVIAQCNLAWAADWFGEQEKGVTYASQAVALAQQARDRLLELMALHQLGDVNFQYSETTKALEIYTQALRIAEELRDLQAQAELRLDIGLGQRDRQATLGEYEKVLTLSQQLSDRQLEARARLRIGGILQSKKEDLPRAAESIEQALALWRQLQDREGEAQALVERASLERLRGEIAKAAESCEQARLRYVELGAVVGQSRALDCKARMAEATPETRASALGLFEQSFALARQAEHRSRIKVALQNIGRLFKNGGDERKADAYYDKLYFGEVRPKPVPWILVAPSKSPANENPHLPDRMKDLLACGTVSLMYRFCVNQEGRVENVRPLKRMPDVDPDIEKTLLSWRFAPRGDVVAIVHTFTFAVSTDDAQCATLRNAPRFTSESVIDGLRTEGQTTLPWTGQPALAPGKSHAVVYRTCYSPEGTVSSLQKVRGISGSDAQIVAALRQNKIQPVLVPLCAFQFFRLTGPPKAEEVPAQRPQIVPAVLIRKEQLFTPDPRLPDLVKIRLRGQVVTASYKICLDEDGTVSSIETLSGIRDADESILSVLLDWRFKPMPVPICFSQFFEYQIE